MRDHNEEKAGLRDSEQSRFRGLGEDRFRGSEEARILDAALAKYAAVEPRAGLEDRVIANVRASIRAEKTRLERTRWRWGLAVQAAIVIVALGLAIRSGRHTEPVVKHSAPIRVPSVPSPEIETKTSETQVAEHAPGTTQKPRRSPQINIALSVHTKNVAKTDPKLDQFPSPHPLTNEEIALVQYVKQFPQEALLIAQAQAEFEAKIQADMQQGATQTEPSGSDEKER